LTLIFQNNLFYKYLTLETVWNIWQLHVKIKRTWESLLILPITNDEKTLYFGSPWSYFDTWDSLAVSTQTLLLTL